MSVARLANIAWDNGDMVEFDRLSCRDLDRTIAEMTTDDLEVRLEVLKLHHQTEGL